MRLPVQLQRVMAAEAEAAREARAKVDCLRKLLRNVFIFSSLTQVIAAQGEQKASQALKEASDVMSESSTALQLRYLQVISKD